MSEFSWLHQYYSFQTKMKSVMFMEAVKIRNVTAADKLKYKKYKKIGVLSENKKCEFFT